MMHDHNSPEGRMAKVIWEASRADEGTISATGADIVASALAHAGFGQQRPLRTRYRVGVECGQRWYRWSSWFPARKHPTRTRPARHIDGSPYRATVWVRRFAGFRRWSGGIAIGPIMVWKETRR